MMTTTDLTLGIYRYLYAGFLTGRRINSVSWFAEAWFWRLHALADDFGNLHGDPMILRSSAAPLREVTSTQAKEWTGELIAEKLIARYAVGSEQYIHIRDFERLQPARKNGKRIQRFPRPSKKILDDPKKSQASQASVSVSDALSVSVPPKPPAEPGGGAPELTVAVRVGDLVDYAAARIGLAGDWPLALIDSILEVYPAAGRKRPMQARRAVEAALDTIRASGKPSPDAWLAQRVRDYAKSPQGRAGMYAGSVADWMANARYDEPPEAWERDMPADKKSPPKSVPEGAW